MRQPVCFMSQTNNEGGRMAELLEPGRYVLPHTAAGIMTIA